MKGMVYLVGAGPGDPDLLTLKALRVLRTADVVLADALVSHEILRMIPAEVLVVSVGKLCGKKSISQEQINNMMTQYAKAGKIVVRLKSGDPLVFGRAGEEMDALREAGIAFEIVPGITAALAAAAAARIPLTDRRSASRLVLATAHHAVGKPAASARDLASRENTIVLYMPNNNYAHIADDLMEGGLSPHTPCLIVSRACRSQQQFCPTTLRDLPDAPDLPSPAVVIVGEVTAQFSRQDASPYREEVTLGAPPLAGFARSGRFESVESKGLP